MENGGVPLFAWDGKRRTFASTDRLLEDDLGARCFRGCQDGEHLFPERERLLRVSHDAAVAVLDAVGVVAVEHDRRSFAYSAQRAEPFARWAGEH